MIDSDRRAHVEEDSSLAPDPEIPVRKSVVILGTRGYPSYYGGFETAVRRLAPYLVSNGWDVTVYGREGSTYDADSTHDMRVNSVVTPGIEMRSFSTLTHGLTSSLHAARSRPDVALVMNVANGYWLPLLRRAKIPTLVNVDGMEWQRAKWGPLAKRIFSTGAKWTARYADRLVCDSVEIARQWQLLFGRTGEFIPYGGTDPGSPALQPGLTHRGYVLIVARLVPENSIDVFFEAARALGKSWPVVIVGSSGYAGLYDSLARDLAASETNITWLGQVSDDDQLSSLWHHSGAYFHGHTVGGTNPALVQAMACGAPVVAVDTVFNREVLGDNAIFVEPDPLEIENAIRRVMDSPELQMNLSSGAVLRASTEYSWDDVCARYDSALTALIAARQVAAQR